jgi:Family of unknown function (DUF6328)
MTAAPDTPIGVRIEHMLTEARVLIPGAQALLGFQLAVMLTDAFGKMPYLSKVVHVASLSCIALAVILLIAPAAFHRISFRGLNTEPFHRLGSGLIVAAAVPLALGFALDLYVAIGRGLESEKIGGIAAAFTLLILAVLWFVQPLVLRATQSSGGTSS